MVWLKVVRQKIDDMRYLNENGAQFPLTASMGKQLKTDSGDEICNYLMNS